MSDANKRMQQFFMQVIELYNAGYTDMEIDYKKKTGEAGKIRILLTDAEVEPTHQAEAKSQNPYICCVCHSTSEQHCDDCKDLCTMAKPAETTTYLTNRGQLARTAYAPKPAKHILCICDDKGTICPVHNTEEFAKVGTPVDGKHGELPTPFDMIKSNLSSSHGNPLFTVDGELSKYAIKAWVPTDGDLNGKQVVMDVVQLYVANAHLQAAVRDNKEDILHRVADVLSWHVSQGNIEMKSRSVEQIMQQLKQEER